MKRLTVLAVVAVLGTGCTDRGLTDVATRSPANPDASLVGAPGNAGLTVMTWNVYYGADPTPLLFVDPADQQALLEATTAVWAQAIATDFPERAGAIAQQIAIQRPDLVGVQEAALYRIQNPSDFLTGNFSPNAETVVFDFLELLTSALKARGMNYVVAVADSTTDIEVPVLLDEAGDIADVRLTDRDAVLVRADLVPRIVGTDHGTYLHYFPISVGPVSTGVYEGWSSVNVKLGMSTYRFISTHLEIQQFPDPNTGVLVQVEQAHELLDMLEDENLPTILVGDFNSDVSGNNPSNATPSYGLITGAGFTDSWLRPLSTPSGLTCCQSDDLTNSVSTFDQRVDFIFTRNLPQVGHAATLVLGRDVLGDDPGDRTTGGLWPSDHAGVAATFLTVSPHYPWANVD